MDNGTLRSSLRLGQRIALDTQQERQVPPHYRPGRQRPYGLAELRRKREEAVARETDYNRGLIARNDKRKQARFRLHRQHAIFAGYTNGYCPEGPDQPVFLGNDKENNKKLKRRSPAGSMRWVRATHVNFRNGYSEAFARADAEARYNQARALENLELSGGMSKSEAVMAARHVTAWAAVLAVAKDKNNLYAGDDVETPTRGELDRQARGLEVFANYKEVYASARLTREAVAHAVSFYRAFAIRFPEDFSADEHTDLFVTRYFELMTHERGVPAATVEEAKHRSFSIEHLRV